MGSNAFLIKETTGIMRCECPRCGETVLVCENDWSGKTEFGADEYFVRCDDCGEFFHTSTDY